MSGIYITGMEMPKDGFLTITVTSDGRVVGNSKKESGKFEYLDNEDIAKAVPVPDHGRLIDADVLTGQMERNLWAIEDKAEKELGFDETLRRGMQYGHAVCVDAVNAAPTIIPADVTDMNVGDNGEPREGQAPPLQPRNDGEEVVTDGEKV